jgi:hypothetical protein
MRRRGEALAHGTQQRGELERLCGFENNPVGVTLANSWGLAPRLKLA